MTRTITRAAAGLFLCGTVTVGVRAYYASQDDGDPNVTTAPATDGSLADEVSATGTLQPVTTVQVGSQLSGTISSLGADFNSIVHKGQVIARLDPSLFESQVDQTRASLARATAEAENSRAQMAAARQTHERIDALWAEDVGGVQRDLIHAPGSGRSYFGACLEIPGQAFKMLVSESRSAASVVSARFQASRSSRSRIASVTTVRKVTGFSASNSQHRAPWCIRNQR